MAQQDYSVEPTVVLPYQYDSLYTEVNRILTDHAHIINDLVTDNNLLDTAVTAINASIAALTAALAAKIQFQFSNATLVKTSGVEELVTSVTSRTTGSTAVFALAASNGVGVPIFFRIRDGVGVGGTLRYTAASVAVNSFGALLWFTATPVSNYSLTTTGAIGDQIVATGLLTMNVAP